MTFASIIEKKKNKIELSKEEIYFLINSYVEGKIKDYQMSSFLMAVWFNSLTDDELYYLTSAMIDSGQTYKLDSLNKPSVDKHSTGGIGDKTSLIFGPVLAYMGIAVGKISGRGLAQTGGTIDKLESCKGWTGDIDNDQFQKQLKEFGLALMGQSKNLVPADKLLYALRDVTGTVDSNVLIASSIMSKKFAMPSDCIIIDVKVGDGAFMKDVESAKKLSKKMVTLANKNGRQLGILLSDMNKPLGKAIGNALEVKEAYDTLNGQGPEDLVELVSFACALALVLTKQRDDLEKAKIEVIEVLNSKKAAYLLEKMITAQHGNFDIIKDYEKNFSTKYSIDILAKSDGFVEYTSTYDMGMLSTALGAGRMTKEEDIDPAAGIYLWKQSSDSVKKGDKIMTLYTNIDNISDFEKRAYELIDIKDKSNKKPIIFDYITS